MPKRRRLFATRDGCKTRKVDLLSCAPKSALPRVQRCLAPRGQDPWLRLPREILALVSRYHQEVREEALDAFVRIMATSGPDVDESSLTELKHLHKLFAFSSNEVWSVPVAKLTRSWKGGLVRLKKDDNLMVRAGIQDTLGDDARYYLLSWTRSVAVARWFHSVFYDTTCATAVWSMRGRNAVWSVWGARYL